MTATLQDPPVSAARSGASAAARMLADAQALLVSIDSPAAEYLGWVRLATDVLHGTETTVTR